MANYKLTQTGQEVQSDLDKVEGIAEIKEIGEGLALSDSGVLSASGTSIPIITVSLSSSGSFTLTSALTGDINVIKPSDTSKPAILVAKGADSKYRGLGKLNNYLYEVIINGTSGIYSTSEYQSALTSAQLSAVNSGIDSAKVSQFEAKQDALPTGENDTYLHKNETTGALEWSSVSAGANFLETEISLVELPEPQPETWIINEEPDTSSEIEETVSFSYNIVNQQGNIIEKTNGNRFNVMNYSVEYGDNFTLYNVYSDYWSTWNYEDGNAEEVIWNYLSLDDSELTLLRTITFDEAPTGDLLTWLQSNATKQ